MEPPLSASVGNGDRDQPSARSQLKKRGRGGRGAGNAPGGVGCDAQSQRQRQGQGQQPPAAQAEVGEHASGEGRGKRGRGRGRVDVPVGGVHAAPQAQKQGGAEAPGQQVQQPAGHEQHQQGSGTLESVPNGAAQDGPMVRGRNMNKKRRGQGDAAGLWESQRALSFVLVFSSGCAFLTNL